jgi:UDP-glucose:(heptosyl)LPS alpha-1,3-glucosyltransferase
VKSPFRSKRTQLFVQRAARYAREHPFDVVHSITPCLAADVYQPRGGAVPEMLERNIATRPALLQRSWKRLEQKLNRKYRVMAELERALVTRPSPPRVIAISQYVADQFTRHYRLNGSLVTRIFNGVDPDLSTPEERAEDRRVLRRQFNFADDDYVVLCVAHNFKLKGVARLIEALGRRGGNTGAAPAHAIIVGRDDPRAFARLAQRLGVADRVIFAGPTKRIHRFFHAADCLAHPTYYDPCSRVVLEAMAAGLPVITTRYNGAAERITHGQEGYVIPSPDDVDGLARCIALLSDEGHRRDCAGRAEDAVADISMEHHAVRVRRVYEEVLRSKVGPRTAAASGGPGEPPE